MIKELCSYRASRRNEASEWEYIFGCEYGKIAVRATAYAVADRDCEAFAKAAYYYKQLLKEKGALFGDEEAINV